MSEAQLSHGPICKVTCQVLASVKKPTFRETQRDYLLPYGIHMAEPSLEPKSEWI